MMQKSSISQHKRGLVLNHSVTAKTFSCLPSLLFHYCTRENRGKWGLWSPDTDKPRPPKLGGHAEHLAHSKLGRGGGGHEKHQRFLRQRPWPIFLAALISCCISEEQAGSPAVPPAALPSAPQVAPGEAQPLLRRLGAAVLLGSADKPVGTLDAVHPPLFPPFFSPFPARSRARSRSSRAAPGAAPGAAPVPAPLRFPLPGTWAAAAGPGASRSTAAARKGGRGEEKRGRPRAGRAGAERGGAEAPAPAPGLRAAVRGRVRVRPWSEAGPVTRPRRGGESKSSDAPGHREVPACPSGLGSPVASVTERRRGSGPAAAAARCPGLCCSVSEEPGRGSPSAAWAQLLLLAWKQPASSFPGSLILRCPSGFIFFLLALEVCLLAARHVFCFPQ